MDKFDAFDCWYEELQRTPTYKESHKDDCRAAFTHGKSLSEQSVAIMYKDCTGHSVNLDEYINSITCRLFDVLSISRRIGKPNLLGDIVSEESAKTAIREALGALALSIKDTASNIK